MEVSSGVALRQLPFFSSGARTNSQSFSSSVWGKNVGGDRDCKVCLKSRNVSSLGFSDNGHLQYYVSPKAGLKKEKEKKKKDPEAASLKKKLKLIKGMSKDLLKFSSMGFGVEAEDGLIAEVKGKKISEATEILLSQLQQLKAEEKELKRKKKEEKALMLMESSSSESSDSECGEVINMTCLRKGTVPEPKPEFEIEAMLTSRPIEIRGAAQTSTTTSSISVMIGERATSEKIEVCIGGKCKKSGATALLEELQERVGIDGAVVGCKCMGKCRDGPNVRIAKDGGPLCIGVSLEDVGVIVGNFFGEEEEEHLGLMLPENNFANQSLQG